jgi:hypothetical protein
MCTSNTLHNCTDVDVHNSRARKFPKVRTGLMVVETEVKKPVSSCMSDSAVDALYEDASSHFEAQSSSFSGLLTLPT